MIYMRSTYHFTKMHYYCLASCTWLASR